VDGGYAHGSLSAHFEHTVVVASHGVRNPDAASRRCRRAKQLLLRGEPCWARIARPDSGAARTLFSIDAARDALSASRGRSPRGEPERLAPHGQGERPDSGRRCQGAVAERLYEVEIEGRHRVTAHIGAGSNGISFACSWGIESSWSWPVGSHRGRSSGRHRHSN